LAARVPAPVNTSSTAQSVTLSAVETMRFRQFWTSTPHEPSFFSP
jgi:hypothetical protein